MELKTLWLGLVISIGAFAVKTGLGWAYLWLKCPPNRKLAATALVAGLYGLLFAFVYLFAARVNIMANYELLTPLWQGGVAMHWLMAVFLLLWGLVLLKSPSPAAGREGRRSRGWLALVIPCPVCLSVILMSSTGLALYFPDNALAATAGLFAVFAAIAAASGLIAMASRPKGSDSLESSLGLAMIALALYFMVSALVTPQFGDLSKVYRLAAHAGENLRHDPRVVAPTLAVLILFAAFGFARERRKLKNRI